MSQLNNLCSPDLDRVILQTPFGALQLIAHGSHLVAALWEKQWHLPRYATILSHATPRASLFLTQVIAAIELYFTKGNPLVVHDLQLSGTAFQHAVWQELRSIPFGTTCSYQDIACRIGRPTAARAVAKAIAANPHVLITPCHRVIGKQGDLIGFSGGLAIKQQLLQLESAFSLEIN